MPGSPRWLIAKGRGDEAKEIFTNYHVDGRVDDPFVELEYREMKQVIKGEMAIETKWKDLIATPGNRPRLLLSIMLGRVTGLERSHPLLPCRDLAVSHSREGVCHSDVCGQAGQPHQLVCQYDWSCSPWLEMLYRICGLAVR